MPRFFLYAFSSSPSQPERPGSFDIRRIEQTEVVHYREEESTSAPAPEFRAIAPAPEPVQGEQPLTEGEGGDVARPVPMVVEEAVETAEQLEHRTV